MYGTKEFFKAKVLPMLGNQKSCLPYLEKGIRVLKNEQNINGEEMQKHLYTLSLVAREVIHRKLFYQVLPDYLDILCKLTTNVENEHVKIELIRCFFRFVQSYSDAIEEIDGAFSKILGFIGKQLHLYDPERHATILMSLDFLRILASQDVELEISTDLIVDVSNLLKMDIWEPAELVEIIELFGQITKDCFDKHSWTRYKPTKPAKYHVVLDFVGLWKRLHGLTLTKSILYCLYHICAMSRDEKLISDTLVELTGENKILKHFMCDCRLSKDDCKVIYELIRNPKICCAFIKIVGVDIDEYSHGPFLETFAPIESVKPSQYMLYAEILGIFPKHEYALRVIPIIYKNILDETLEKNVRAGIECITNLCVSWKDLPQYDKWISIQTSLLKNSLVSVGHCVLQGLERVLALNIKPVSKPMLDIFIMVLRKEFTKDKKPLQVESEENRDLESEIVHSVITILLDVEISSHTKEIFETCCWALKQDCVYEKDDEEKILLAKLASKYSTNKDLFIASIKRAIKVVDDQEICDELTTFIQQ